MIDKRAGEPSKSGESGKLAPPRAIRRALWVVALFAMAFSAAPATAQNKIQQDIDAILADSGYQRSLPEAAPQEIQLPQFKLFESFFDTVKPILEFLAWILVAVGLVLLLYSSYRAITGYLGRHAQTQSLPSTESVPGTGTETALQRNLMDQIERLAGTGAFGEAVHLLLLLCFEELYRNSPPDRDRALTSRELLARMSLPPLAQNGLAFIVSAVEVGHFGGRQISRATYERCLDGYRNVVANRSA